MKKREKPTLILETFSLENGYSEKCEIVGDLEGMEERTLTIVHGIHVRLFDSAGDGAPVLSGMR